MRSGFVAFVGRPNAGKSTLTNAIVGEKIAIASDKPQTTRHAIRGVYTDEKRQLVIVDTPGLHRPRTLLGERLNDIVYETWAEVDVIGVCLPANQKIGPGDEFLLNEISKLEQKPKLVALATKIDLVSKERLLQHLVAIDLLAQKLGLSWAEIIPVSALTGAQVELVVREVGKLLPKGVALYPEDVKTEDSLEKRIAELIREAVLADVRDELPHSVTVVIDEMQNQERLGKSPVLKIYASLVLERDSQKGIIIGHKGTRLKEIGAKARREISDMLRQPVFLALHVKVEKEWQRNPKLLNRLGF